MTKEQKQLLACFPPYGDEAFYYLYFERKLGWSRAEVKIEMDELRELGYVEYVKGLFSEDGKTAGSGFVITKEGTDQLDD